ncbi:MAG: hypothetical protein AVDCRST_MAG14-2330, partial [uncultured Rubrobacteraceae bacterium]
EPAPPGAGVGDLRDRNGQLRVRRVARGRSRRPIGLRGYRRTVDHPVRHRLRCRFSDTRDDYEPGWEEAASHRLPCRVYRGQRGRRGTFLLWAAPCLQGDSCMRSRDLYPHDGGRRRESGSPRETRPSPGYRHGRADDRVRIWYPLGHPGWRLLRLAGSLRAGGRAWGRRADRHSGAPAGHRESFTRELAGTSGGRAATRRRRCSKPHRHRARGRFRGVHVYRPAHGGNYRLRGEGNKRDAPALRAGRYSGQRPWGLRRRSLGLRAKPGRDLRRRHALAAGSLAPYAGGRLSSGGRRGGGGAGNLERGRMGDHAFPTTPASRAGSPAREHRSLPQRLRHLPRPGRRRGSRSPCPKLWLSGLPGVGGRPLRRGRTGRAGVRDAHRRFEKQVPGL